MAASVHSQTPGSEYTAERLAQDRRDLEAKVKRVTADREHVECQQAQPHRDGASLPVRCNLSTEFDMHDRDEVLL
jgi:hypothetical protein